MTHFKKTLLLGAAAITLMSASAPVMAADLACLITKNNTNPFFVKMKEGCRHGSRARFQGLCR